VVFTDAELLLALARLTTLGDQSEKRADIARPTKALRIAEGEHEVQRRHRSDAWHLAEERRLWVLGTGDVFHGAVILFDLSTQRRDRVEEGAKARLQVRRDQGRRFLREPARVTRRQPDPDGLHDTAHRVDQSRPRSNEQGTRAQLGDVRIVLMSDVRDGCEQRRIRTRQPGEQLRVHLVALPDARRNELHHTGIRDEHFVSPRRQLLADPPRVATDFDRNARRREPLEMTRQRLRRRPNSAFGETLAVRTEETAVTVAIPEIDADRDRSRRCDFRAALQLCDLRQAATCCHGMPPGHVVPNGTAPSHPIFMSVEGPSRVPTRREAQRTSPAATA
jgi:hypothetical protein